MLHKRRRKDGVGREGETAADAGFGAELNAVSSLDGGKYDAVDMRTKRNA